MDDVIKRNCHTIMCLRRSLPKRIERLTKDRDEVRSTLDRLEYMLSSAKDQLTATTWALEKFKADHGYDYTQFINEEETQDE